ncbi:hypothetical protein KUCAC02_007767 [Chaenocephalus aceratus]|uniref:Uncharacterized protein n=1 Tax=Chaenocephalus aceratus TaxID=36190 RepID=A0ACB9X879_CHAAC|nr:hypothetical protein KUCAC02_007767 [Chaenocephalus aceratus]
MQSLFGGGQGDAQEEPDREGRADAGEDAQEEPERESRADAGERMLRRNRREGRADAGEDAQEEPERGRADAGEDAQEEPEREGELMQERMLRRTWSNSPQSLAPLVATTPCFT